jgi:hypothetical protein
MSLNLKDNFITTDMFFNIEYVLNYPVDKAFENNHAPYYHSLHLFIIQLSQKYFIG